MVQALVSGIWQGQPFGPIDVHLSEHFTREEEKREVLEKLGAAAPPNDLWGHIVEQFNGIHQGDGDARDIATQAGFTALNYRLPDREEPVDII